MPSPPLTTSALRGAPSLGSDRDKKAIVYAESMAKWAAFGAEIRNLQKHGATETDPLTLTH